MKADSFRTRVEIIHKKWLARVLYLNHGHDWIDLYTDLFYQDGIYFELKCRMQKYRPVGKEAWACRENQIQQYSQTFGDKNVYWMFLIYKLDRNVIEIKNHIAKKILNREVWILPWNFIYQYEKKWCRAGFYRYPKQKDFPEKMNKKIIENVMFHYVDTRIEKFLNKAIEGPF